MADLEYRINRDGNLVCTNVINPDELDKSKKSLESVHNSWESVYSELQELIELWYDIAYYKTFNDHDTLLTLYPKYRLKVQKLIEFLNESIDQDE